MDSGKPFDPLAKKDADTSLSADERVIGGLGILMVKKSMDDVRYSYKNGKNILIIIKILIEKILGIIEMNAEYSTEQIAAELDLKGARTRQLLKELVEQDKIECIGVTKYRKYKK